ncbi:MAG: acyl-CoA dehydrogenase family protein, partial [Nannocystaceae bacterium]
QKRLASLDRVEEKLGHHGSVTATVTFEKTPARLIGKRGEGFKYMLMLMNNARLGVGFESLGLCESAYRLAREYAEQRPSMGKTIDRHELIADMLDEMESDIEAIRALCVHAGYHEELSRKLDMMLQLQPPSSELARKQAARKIKHHKWIARRATPLLKYFASEKAVEMARKCMQIHGGNGYMKEYGAEKLLRDSLVMPIYEGTSQIQSLMAMKDTLGRIIKNPQAFVKRVAQTRWRALSARDPLERRVLRLSQTSLSAQQFLIRKTAADKVKSLQELPMSSWTKTFFKGWNPKRDFAFAMLHAERLLKILTDELVAEILLEQVQRHPERRPVLERFLERAEPRSRALLDEMQSMGTRLLNQLAGTTSEQQAG